VCSQRRVAKRGSARWRRGQVIEWRRVWGGGAVLHKTRCDAQAGPAAAVAAPHHVADDSRNDAAGQRPDDVRLKYIYTRTMP